MRTLTVMVVFAGIRKRVITPMAIVGVFGTLIIFAEGAAAMSTFLDKGVVHRDIGGGVGGAGDPPTLNALVVGESAMLTVSPWPC